MGNTFLFDLRYAISREAERRAGKLIREMQEQGRQQLKEKIPEAEKGARRQLAGRDELRGCIKQPREDIPTYAELGIERTQAHRWQIEASSGASLSSLMAYFTLRSETLNQVATFSRLRGSYLEDTVSSKYSSLPQRV